MNKTVFDLIFLVTFIVCRLLTIKYCKRDGVFNDFFWGALLGSLMAMAEFKLFYSGGTP